MHLGLQHILEGKSAFCWNCSEVYTMSAEALRDEMPLCDQCRGKKKPITITTEQQIIQVDPSLDLEAMIEKNMADRLQAKIKGEEYIPDEIKSNDEGDVIESFNPVEESDDGNFEA